MQATRSIERFCEDGSHQRPDFATRDIGGVGIAVMNREQAIATVADAMSSRGHLKLAFCNANLVNASSSDPALLQRLSRFLVLADGIGVDIGSRLLYGSAFPANLNGTDFIPAFLADRQSPMRVALLGGRPGVADRAAEQLAQRFPAHRFEVLSHGYYAPEEEAWLLDKLREDRPDLLLVAMGNPLQERFIAEELKPEHCSVAAGIGALFDFLAGEVVRAPAPLRRLRLEWAYRLFLEPRRLWRRYMLGNPIFLMRMLRQYAVGDRSSG